MQTAPVAFPSIRGAMIYQTVKTDPTKTTVGLSSVLADLMSFSVPADSVSKSSRNATGIQTVMMARMKPTVPASRGSSIATTVGALSCNTSVTVETTAGTSRMNRTAQPLLLFLGAPETSLPVVMDIALGRSLYATDNMTVQTDRMNTIVRRLYV